jgi:hypothetical protein
VWDSSLTFHKSREVLPKLRQVGGRGRRVGVSASSPHAHPAFGEKRLLRAWRVGSRSRATGVARLCKPFYIKAPPVLRLVRFYGRETPVARERNPTTHSRGGTHHAHAAPADTRLSPCRLVRSRSIGSQVSSWFPGRIGCDHRR